MKKKMIGVLLALCMVLTLVPMTAFAAGTVDTWDGTAASEFAGGNGTESAPYQISSAEQFAYFAECLKNNESFKTYYDKYYVLTSDIDLRGHNWTPIRGTRNDVFNSTYFKGSLDGQGHTVSYEFTKSERTSDYEGYGLFGFSEGAFSNLNIEGNLTIDCGVGASWGGGLAGLQAGDVSNCTSSVNITVTKNATTNSCFFGGLVGEMQAGTMKNCLYKGKISANQKNAMGDFACGGLSGSLYAGTITACKNEGIIDGGEYGNIGGIAGMIYTGGHGVNTTISDCYHTGSVSGKKRIGGIAGYVSAIISADEQGNAISKVVNCYVTGTVSQGTEFHSAVCGLVQSTDYGNQNRATATVENSYYTADVGISDDNATQATLTEIFDKITKNAPEGLWVKDNSGSPVLFWELADYTAVDTAIEKIPTDLSQYTDESVAKVNEAKTAVVRNLLRNEQATVDEYATAIENAIKALEYKGADYSKVDEAIAKAEALDKNQYKDFSAVEAAVKAVVRGKNITEQADVDAMAKTINDAISALEKKSSTESGSTTKPSETNPNTGSDTNSPQTGDTSNMALWIALLFVSAAGVFGTTVYGKKKKSMR